MERSTAARSRGTTKLLLVAAAVGLSLAIADILIDRPSGVDWPDDDAVARVGDAKIPMRRYEELLSDLAADSREPLSAEDRRFALQRLIDEELLILRAEELEVQRHVAAVRKAMANAILAQIVSESSAEPPTDEALMQLYRTEAEFFAQSARYTVRWYRLDGLGEDEVETATEIGRQLAASAISADFAGRVERVADLPLAPLPESSLSNHLGATLTEAAVVLEPGGFSDPVFVRGRWHVVELVEAAPRSLGSFEELRPLLLAELRKRDSDRALRDYLEWLRGRTEIEVRPGVQ